MAGSASINPAQIADLQQAWQTDPGSLGVGLYNPATGEILLGSFDGPGLGIGHEGLAQSYGIADTSQWQGFTLGSDGTFVPTSAMNIPWSGGVSMLPADADQVLQALQQAGLAN